MLDDRLDSSLVKRMQAAGWTADGDKIPSRLKVIYDTNVKMAFARGQFEHLQMNKDARPYLRYKQVERKTKRNEHSAFNGKVYHIDDPIWQTIYPPSAFGCGCGVEPLRTSDNVSDGVKDLERFKDIIAKEHNISPFKAYEPDVSKYVKGIKDKLQEYLKNKPENATGRALLQNILGFNNIINNRSENNYEDGALKSLFNAIGFDKQGELLKKDVIATRDMSNYYECYRGVPETELYKSFQSGELFAGTGMHGNGSYFAYTDGDNNAKLVAQDYAGKDWFGKVKPVMKMYFPKDANILNKDDMNDPKSYYGDLLLNKEPGTYDKYFNVIIGRGDSNLKDVAHNYLKSESDNYVKAVKDFESNGGQLNLERGFVAALSGYDAIIIPRLNYIVILNRSKCIIQEEYE